MHISSKMHEEGFQINNNFIFLKYRNESEIYIKKRAEN